MDFEPIVNISINETFDTEETYRTERQNALDVPILLTATAGIIADIIITYTILRNKELRTRTNIYIVNLCICNFFYLFFTPLILNLFSATEKIHASAICFTDELFFLFMLGNYIFICILLLDWYVVTYKSLNASARCRASNKLVITSVWLILGVFLMTVFLQCSSGVSLYLFIALIALIFYFISFIFVAFICIMKLINQRTTSVVEVKSYTELLYVISYFLCWLPNWLYIFVLVFARIVKGAAILGLCTFIIGYVHSVILLYIMYTKDVKFRNALRKWIFNEQPRNEEDNHKSDEHFTTLL